jgi:hypothetical protein
MMKKLLLSVFTISTLFSFSQDLLSTELSTRNALIEEFTATGCGNCPGGHSVSTVIESENLNKVFSIRYHHGYLANPNGNNLDFRTNFSEALASQAQLVGQPLATVNRHIFNGQNKTAQSFGNWESSCLEIIEQNAVVNIGAKAILDTITNELEITIELYYTGSQSVDSNLLNVALLQNNIVANQAVYTIPRPNDFLESGLYLHKHALRHLITGQWGLPIKINEGPFISKKINYNIPEAFRNIPTDLNNLELVIFVNENRQEVLNVIKIIPEFGSVETTSDADFDTNLITNIYPNPVNKNASVNIETPSKRINKINLVDITGKIIQSNDSFKEKTTIPLKGLGYNPGIYLIQFNQNEKTISNQKLIIY